MNYHQWNKLLLDYFFNKANAGKWIYNLFIDRQILNDLAASETGYEDFIKSIDIKIGRGSDFFTELQTSSTTPSKNTCSMESSSLKRRPSILAFCYS
jgi:hypothetical protein